MNDTYFLYRQLVMNGFLLPHLQVGLYWFSIRKQGHFMTNVSNGRSEITRILKKRATKDIMESVSLWIIKFIIDM